MAGNPLPENGTDDRSDIPPAVYWGLFAAWLANDVEEILTMARWSRAAAPRLRERFPRVPAVVWDRVAVTQPQVNAAIGAMALFIAAAAADGARTGGRSALFRTVLTGFGLHGAVHVAQAAAYRGYTPGVVTSPTVVIPYSLWALGRLRRAGLPPARPLPALALLPVAAGAAQALGGRLTRRRAAPGDRPAGNQTRRIR